MKCCSLLLLVVVCVVVAKAASAEPMRKDSIELVEPGRMIDRATLPTKMAWCSGKYAGETWPEDRIRRTFGSRNVESWADGAVHLCQQPNDPVWLLQAQQVLQLWMNERNMSQADAEADIVATIAQIADARANAGKPQSDEQRMAFSDNDFSPMTADPGVATAKITGAPAWCDKAKITEKWEPGRIGRTVGDKYGIDGTVNGALHICQRPNDTTWKKQAGYIVQKWMNFGHLTQADAEASLRARIQQTKFASEHDALCKGLEVGPEVGGETRANAEGAQRFFGCGRELPLWLDKTDSKGAVGFYFDAAPHPDSEIMRLYWLFHFVQAPWATGHDLPSNDAGENRTLLYYAIAQNDFAHIDTNALDKMLSAPPYNDYARTIVMESLGMLKAEQQAYEAAIAKLAKGDKDYEHILHEVPKQAFADWDKKTAEWKTELDHSNAFEKKLSEPSRSVLKGCSVQLQKDVEKLIRSYKEKTYQGLISKIDSDPIASLLISRLALCDAADEIYGLSGALADLVKNGRDQRGPRSATYYALVEAIAIAHKDRPRLLLQDEGFTFQSVGDGTTSLIRLYEGSLKLTGNAPRDPEKNAIRGVVKAVNKVPDGLQIVFKTDKLVYPEMACTDDTSHPLRVGDDGRIEYYRNCKNTGKMASQDNTPRPIVIPVAAAAGVKPGVTVVVGTSGQAKSGDSLGYVVYVKKSAKDPKIDTFFGFTL